MCEIDRVHLCRAMHAVLHTSVIGVSLFSAETMAFTSLMLQLRATRLRPLSMDWGRDSRGGKKGEREGGREGGRMEEGGVSETKRIHVNTLRDIECFHHISFC